MKNIVETNDDIISEWQEEISEEELDKLAKEYFPESYINVDVSDVREAFVAGYRKAKGL